MSGDKHTNAQRRKRILNSDSIEVTLEYGKMEDIKQLLIPVRYDASYFPKVLEFDKNENGECCLPAQVLKAVLRTLTPPEKEKDFRKWILVQPQLIPVLQNGKPLKHADIHNMYTTFEMANPWPERKGPLRAETAEKVSIRFTIYHVAKFVSKDLLEDLFKKTDRFSHKWYDGRFEWPIKSVTIKQKPRRKRYRINKNTRNVGRLLELQKRQIKQGEAI